MPRLAALSVVGAAWLLGLVPLAWLGFQHRAGHEVRREEVWLAGAFGVSFVADTLAYLFGSADVIGNVYPILQVSIVGMVLLDRIGASHLLGLLVTVAIVAVAWQGPDGHDVLLRTVAWLAVVGLALHMDGPMRAVLLVYFGLGWLAWIVWARWPSAGWYFEHGTRLLGTLLFCRAALRPGPSLRLETA